MRFVTTILCLLLTLSAVSALGREKTPDRMDVTSEAMFNAPVTGSLTPASGTYDRIYTQGEVALGCGAIATDSANDGMYFDLYCFQVDDRQAIELILDTAGTNIIDPVMTIYCSPFDPTQPELNVVAFDDDSGMGALSAFSTAHDIRLEPGQEYWLVISAYGANMTGDYVVQRSSNVYDCGAVANEASSWGAVKGMYR